MSGKFLKEDLEATKRLLIDCGWIRDEYGSKETGFCLLGALEYHIVVEEHDGNPDRYNDAFGHIAETVGPFPADWNDAQDNVYRVLDMLDERIAAA